MPPTSTRCDARRAVLPWQVLLAFLVTAVSARAADDGFPLITVYPPEAHRAGPQTFDIAQDPRGVLYFGNLHGLVSFDGAWWRLLTLPDDQVALSVASDARGRVALGLVNDFGYLTHDAGGSPTYQSLLSRIPEEKRRIGDVRAICTTADGFLFVTEKSLLFWNGAETRWIRDFAPQFETDTEPRGCWSEGNRVLLRGPKGVHAFDLKSGAITPAGLERHVTVLIGAADGRLVAGARDEGLFALEGSAWNPFAPEASAWLAGKLITGGTRLRDGRLVITTRQNGLLILEPDGAIEQIISEDAGLPDAIINEARVDREGALWLAMEGPIVRIDLASPVTVFDVRRGIRGSAGDVARFAGRLYTATTHGLYQIDGEGEGRRMPGLREGTWRLLVVDDELLVGTPKGVYSVTPADAIEHVLPKETEIYDLFRSPGNPSRVWMAVGDGLASIARDREGWRYEGVVDGVPPYISSVVEKDGVVWCGSVFNGIVRIDGIRTPQQRVKQYGSGEMNVYPIAGAPRFVRANGAILHVGQGDQLAPDPLLGHITAPRGFFIAMEDTRGDVWINSTPPRVFERQDDGSFAREGKPLVAVTAADIQSLRTTRDGVVWFASDKGLFRYEPGDDGGALEAQPQPLIRRVLAGENRLLFGGAAGAARLRPELRYRFGRIRLEFGPASFRPGVLYQYRLDPMDESWSEWTDQPFIDYTSLDPNDYTFRLRARGSGAAPGPETQWQFTVLSPWYRTGVAWALWVVLAAASVMAVIRVRTSTLRRQAEILREKVAEKTAELQETVKLLESANARLEILSLEDDLTGIANRRYFERALSEEWNRARRREQPLALILLDLDHFKDLNDRRGHPAGDDCLRRIGALLAETIRRSGEVVARYGGEEFGILLPGVDADGAIRVAEGLREGIERLCIPYGAGSNRCVTASCGVAALTPNAGLTAEQLVLTADRALYAAKHAGRNCVRVADEGATRSWLHDAAG